MMEDAQALARQIQALGRREASVELLRCGEPLASMALTLVPEQVAREIIDEVALLLVRGSDLRLRTNAVWLLRETRGIAMQRAEGAIVGVLLDPDETDSLRSLALDSMEHLWLAGSIPTTEFRTRMERLKTEKGSDARRRWYAVLGNVDADWAVHCLRESLIRDAEASGLNALARSRAPGARAAIVELRKRAEGDMRRALDATLKDYDITAAKMRVSRGDHCIDDEAVRALIDGNEFATLHKALTNGQIMPEQLSQWDGTAIPAELSKSQRRFLRMLGKELRSRRG